MSIPYIPTDQLPTRDDPGTFPTRANNAWASLSASIIGINLAITTIAAAEAAVAGGVLANLWVTGQLYTAGDRAFSPINGSLYLRLTNGAGTTDPSADATNWLRLDRKLPPLQIESAQTRTLAKGDLVVFRNAGVSEATFPAGAVPGDQVYIRFANGRTDNLYHGNGWPVLGLEEHVIETIPDYGALWVLTDSTYGWADI